MNVDSARRFGASGLGDCGLIALRLLAICACNAYQKLIFRERHRAHAFRTKNRVDGRSPTAKPGSGCLVFQGADWGMRDINHWWTIKAVTTVTVSRAISVEIAD